MRYAVCGQATAIKPAATDPAAINPTATDPAAINPTATDPAAGKPGAGPWRQIGLTPANGGAYSVAYILATATLILRAGAEDAV